MSSHLFVTLAGRDQLMRQREHFTRGCFFVPVPDPAPQPFSELQVTLVAPTGRLNCRAQVIQIAPGAGVALACTDAAALSAAFEQWLQTALAAAAQQGAAQQGAEEAAASSWEDPATTAAAAQTTATSHTGSGAQAGELRLDLEDGEPLHEKLRSLGMGEKRRLAMHGDRTTRQLLLKDPNKALHTLVLRNRNITVEEVRFLAGYRQANPEALNQIADNREWTQNPFVVMSLVTNPKTPGNTATRLLSKLSKSEIRRLAKSPNTPRAVAIACRKLVAK